MTSKRTPATAIINTVIVILTLVLTSTSFAQIYQWRDKDGQLHFGDQPPKQANAQEVNVKINSYENVEVVNDLNLGSSSKKKNKRGSRVVIYSTTRCGYCKKAKRHFSKNNIAYTEYDVEKSSKGKRDYKKMNGTGVPIILVGNTRINGFTSSRFDKIYYSKKKK